MVKVHIPSIGLLLSLLLVTVNCTWQLKQQDDSSQDFGLFSGGSSIGDSQRHIVGKLKQHLVQGLHGFKGLFGLKNNGGILGGSTYGREDKYEPNKPYKPEYEKETNYNKKETPETYYSTSYENNKKNILPSSGFNQGSQVGGVDEIFKGESKQEFKETKEPEENKEVKVDKEDKEDNSDKVDKQEKFDKVDKADKEDKFDKVDKQDKQDKFDKVEKVDKVDKFSEFGGVKPFKFEYGGPSIERKFGARYAAYGRNPFGQNYDYHFDLKKHRRYRRSVNRPYISQRPFGKRYTKFNRQRRPSYG